jgi:hypothetical protein
MKITVMAAMMVAAIAWAQPSEIDKANEQQSAQFAKISVHVADYAQLGDTTLRRAGTILSAIFRKADVDVTVVLHSEDRTDLEESAWPRLCRLYVYILPQKMAKQLEGQSRPNVMGIAPNSHVSQNCVLAYVFSQAVLQLATEQSSVDRGRLLGYVMAHEIGHLLLLSHSPAGIMRSQWDDDDMRQMTQGGLSFDAQEAAEIRMEVARRHSGQAPMELMAAW